jgi:mRNA interferase RelE/StbE
VYKIYLLPQTKKDLETFRKKIFQQLENKISSLSKDPRPPGSVKLTAEEGYCIRYGNYRIIYRIEDKERIVYIYRIKHRKEVYK